ncbi:MAG: PH domain-containing protein [Gammaproteobacteria bacterium]|nr:PH domain-containing protein [Gammaproteobacteria bacterium]
MEESLESPDIERKLHNISPFFILWENIKKLIFPALIALLGTRSSSWEFYALGGAALVSIISIIQYRFYRYWLEDDQIRVKEGIIFRNLRQVKYDKIQNLNLVQGPLHRIFGVVKVQLESASGGKPEAIINVISQDAVKELQHILQQYDAGNTTMTSDASETIKQDSILKLNFAEIIRYGLISNKGLIAVAVFFGFISQFMDDDNPRNVRAAIRTGVNYVSDGVQSLVPEASVMGTVLYSLAFILMALIILWILSIGMAWFKFHGFDLIKNNGKLAASMGLLTRLQATIPTKRIQTITVHNSWLHQMFDRVGVTIETAGGVNSEQQGVTMKQVAPVMPVAEKAEFLQQIQSDQEWSNLQWQPVEARAWKRVFKASSLIWTLVLLTLLTHSVWTYAACLVLAMVWSFFYAKAYIKNTGYFITNKMAAFKSGVVFRKETYVRLPKVQTVRIKESLFDRRHKMAKLELDTAGATVGAHHVEIPYINYETAEKLYQQVSTNIKNSEFEW